MIRIRLARVGKKGRPSYRIVVADVAAPRDGSYLEWIGNYDPMADPPAVTLKNERASHWLSMGAVPSDAVARIMDQNGLMERSHTFKTAAKKSAEEESGGGG
ncbi:MAG: 30S ribosomal protein S16, partial [Dehalococcoidia bacterium]|nr:30S ribosomal protein S16 [Dehalococcoidia bacterium]